MLAVGVVGKVIGMGLKSINSLLSGISVTAEAGATAGEAAGLLVDSALLGGVVGEALAAGEYYGQQAMDEVGEALFNAGEMFSGFAQMMSDDFMDYYFR